jgi:hypothetical protein
VYSLARSLSSIAMIFVTFTPEVSSYSCFAVLTSTDDCRLDSLSLSLSPFFWGVFFLCFCQGRKVTKDPWRFAMMRNNIMSGHLRAPLAAIAEIMLQCLSNNAPDLLTHLLTHLSLSLSLSLVLISVTPSFLAILTHLCVRLLLTSGTPSCLLWTLRNPLALIKCSLNIP